jgi:hypothetical protein
MTTGGTSALVAGWLVKWLFKNWVQHHDETIAALGVSVQALTVEVAKVSAVVARFDAAMEKVASIDKSVAVLDHRMSGVETHVANGA